jgi:hypothetical protein
MLRDDVELVKRMIQAEIAAAFKAIPVVKAETPKPVEVVVEPAPKAEAPLRRGKKED